MQFQRLSDEREKPFLPCKSLNGLDEAFGGEGLLQEKGGLLPPPYYSGKLPSRGWIFTSLQFPSRADFRDLAEGPVPSTLRGRQNSSLTLPNAISLPALRSLFLKHSHFRARLEKALQYLFESWVSVQKCLGDMYCTSACASGPIQTEYSFLKYTYPYFKGYRQLCLKF